jgi:Protein of unknown function (DUF4231)
VRPTLRLPPQSAPCRLIAVSDLDARNQLAITRCDQQIDWYEAQSKQANLLCRLFQTAAVLLGAITPVLILWDGVAAPLQALPAVLGSVSAGILAIYGWQDNKARFAVAAEALKSEKLRYQTRTGAYDGDPNRALSQFVSSIESIAMAETSEWRRSFVKSGQRMDVGAVEPKAEADAGMTPRTGDIPAANQRSGSGSAATGG